MPQANSVQPFPAITFTIKQAVESLGFGTWLTKTGAPQLPLFRWPPDVFAMAATILKESGAYLQAARPHAYPNKCGFDLAGWQSYVEKQANQWRPLDSRTANPPDEVRRLLREVAGQARAGLKLYDLAVAAESNLLWLPYLERLSKPLLEYVPADQAAADG